MLEMLLPRLRHFFEADEARAPLKVDTCVSAKVRHFCCEQAKSAQGQLTLCCLLSLLAPTVLQGLSASCAGAGSAHGGAPGRPARHYLGPHRGVLGKQDIIVSPRVSWPR